MSSGGASFDDGDDAEDFEAIFKMMQGRGSERPCAVGAKVGGPAAADGLPAAKRPRTLALDEEQVTLPPVVAATSSQAGASGPSSCEQLVAKPRAEELEAPPERVALAFALLELPLSATSADVARSGRRLARRSHPDKVATDFPEKREEAHLKFLELQDAQEVAHAWLQGRLRIENDQECLNSSDDEVSSVASDIAGDEETRNNNKACGIGETAGDWEEPKSPVGAVRGEDEDDDDDPFGERPDGPGLGPSGLRVADMSGGIVNASDNVVEQAASLSAHMERMKAKSARICSECFERKVALENDDLCSVCKKELDRLWKSLGRRC